MVYTSLVVMETAPQVTRIQATSYSGWSSSPDIMNVYIKEKTVKILLYYEEIKDSLNLNN